MTPSPPAPCDSGAMVRRWVRPSRGPRVGWAAARGGPRVRGSAALVDDAVDRKHLPGRRRRPGRRGALHRLAGAAGGGARRARPRRQRARHRLRRGIEDPPARGLGRHDRGRRCVAGQGEHPRCVGSRRPAGRRETFLYLAFTREDGKGTAAITFELNRDGRLWDNGHTKIPCRKTGDVLVTTLPHGNDIDIALAQWTTVTADAATGCARTGRIDTMATIPAGTAQGAVNARPITSRLPGTFPPGTQIPVADVQRSGAESERPDGGRVRRRVLRVRVDLDALALVGRGELQRAGLRHSAARERADLRRVRNEVLRPRRRWRPRRGRAGHPALPDLGRLRRRRRARRERAICGHRQRTVAT